MKKINTIIFWVSLIILFLYYSSKGGIKGLFAKDKQAALLSAMSEWGKRLMQVNRIRYSADGLENIDPEKNYIFAANHQSVIDILVLAAAMPVPFVFMVKKSLFKVPLFGRYMRRAGFIAVDRKNPRRDYEMIMKAVQKRPVNILIFPEGTRSYDGTLAPFKSGVAKFAELLDFQTIPIALQGTVDIMNRGNLNMRPGTVKAVLGNAITWENDKKAYLETLRDEIASMM